MLKNASPISSAVRVDGDKPLTVFAVLGFVHWSIWLETFWWGLPYIAKMYSSPRCSETFCSLQRPRGSLEADCTRT